jgi:hypothetical protein
MARDNKHRMPRDAEDQEEMTVVILRFKGGGDTLRKGFDTVSQALAALGPTPSQHRIPPQRMAELTPADGTKIASPESADDFEDDREFEAAETVKGEAPREKGQRRYSTPTFLTDLNLNPEGQPPWKEYANGKNPQTLNDKYLVAAAWLTKHGGQEVFTNDHLFTCFRSMRWEEQKDFAQPVRRMKHQSSYFDSPARGQWKLTGHGLETAEAVTRSAAEQLT